MLDPRSTRDMGIDGFDRVLTQEALDRLFPRERANRFFDSLLGDSSEGAYDIRLEYKGYTGDTLRFEFLLLQRPNKCLACHLTAGLPDVFSRHPVIDIQGLVQEIERMIHGSATCAAWKLGPTLEKAPDLHAIPFTIRLA